VTRLGWSSSWTMSYPGLSEITGAVERRRLLEGVSEVSGVSKSSLDQLSRSAYLLKRYFVPR
jgi:hypothetical protein